MLVEMAVLERVVKYLLLMILNLRTFFRSSFPASDFGLPRYVGFNALQGTYSPSAPESVKSYLDNKSVDKIHKIHRPKLNSENIVKVLTPN
jgi:hypothetical protein